MKLITQRDLIREVAKRWHRAYAPFKPDGPLFSVRTGLRDDLSKEEIYDHLLALDPETATPEQIENIIGNDSWTSLRCHECDCECTAVVEVGEEPDYESRTAHLCPQCVKSAYDLLPK